MKWGLEIGDPAEPMVCRAGCLLVLVTGTGTSSTLVPF